MDIFSFFRRVMIETKFSNCESKARYLLLSFTITKISLSLQNSSVYKSSYFVNLRPLQRVGWFSHRNVFYELFNLCLDWVIFCNKEMLSSSLKHCASNCWYWMFLNNSKLLASWVIIESYPWFFKFSKIL